MLSGSTENIMFSEVVVIKISESESKDVKFVENYSVWFWMVYLRLIDIWNKPLL